MFVLRFLLIATRIQTYEHEDNHNLIYYLQTSHSTKWYMVCQKIRENPMINRIVLGNRFVINKRSLLQYISTFTNSTVSRKRKFL